MTTEITDNGPELTIEARTEAVGAKKVQVLHCTGYVDATTFDRFQRVVTGSLDAHQYNIVLDMGGITYIHSTGFGLLLAAHRQAEANDGNLVIAGLASKVANIFGLLGFDHIIQTQATLEEALATFA